MLYPDWIIGETDPALVSLEDVANHIEHVCDIAGNCHHAALGTDLDGGFGKEQTPHDLETIEELGKVGAILSARGFTDDDINAILRDNCIRFVRHSLPAE